VKEETEFKVPSQDSEQAVRDMAIAI